MQANRRQPEQDIIKVSRHRNGVSGEPFYVALIRDRKEGGKKVIIYFPVLDQDDEPLLDEQGRNPHIAVLDPELLAQGDIGFDWSVVTGENQWRGEHYLEHAYAAVRLFDQQQEVYVEARNEEQRKGLDTFTLEPRPPRRS